MNECSGSRTLRSRLRALPQSYGYLPLDPNTDASVAGAQPVKSCSNLGPFHAADEARIVGAEAALRPARTACSTGCQPSCQPKINLTEMGDLACHTPLGMT